MARLSYTRLSSFPSFLLKSTGMRGWARTRQLRGISRCYVAHVSLSLSLSFLFVVFSFSLLPRRKRNSSFSLIEPVVLNDGRPLLRHTRTGETGPLFPEPTGQMHLGKLSPGSVFYTHESLCARHSFSFFFSSLLLLFGRWKCRRRYTTCLPVSRLPGMHSYKGRLTAEMRRRNKWHVDVTKEQPLVFFCGFSFVCLPTFLLSLLCVPLSI